MDSNAPIVVIAKKAQLVNFMSRFQFTYTSDDVQRFNDEYYRLYQYYPFTDTTRKASKLDSIDINTDDIKKFWGYAKLAYDNENEGELISEGNSQAVVFVNDNFFVQQNEEVIISFRGTENDNNTEMSYGFMPQDYFSDFTNNIELASSFGWVGIEEGDDVMVHQGFNDYVDAIYDVILEKYILKDTTKTFYITGHSLGKVAAVIFAYRLFLEMRFRGIDINIKGVWGYGGVKGIYSPNNSICNYLNIYSVFHYRDPVPYWFPIYGDAPGTKIVLYGGGDYEVIYKDQITPYIGINLGNSLEYFNRLKNDPNYKNEKIKDWNGFFSSVSRDFFEGVGLKAFRDLYGSTIKYPTGQYSAVLTYASDGTQHSSAGYDDSIGKLQDNLFISKQIEGDYSEDIPQQQPQPFYNYDYHLFENVDIEDNKRFHVYSKNIKATPKILGYVINYNNSMNNQKIIF